MREYRTDETISAEIWQALLSGDETRARMLARERHLTPMYVQLQEAERSVCSFWESVSNGEYATEPGRRYFDRAKERVTGRLTRARALLRDAERNYSG